MKEIVAFVSGVLGIGLIVLVAMALLFALVAGLGIGAAVMTEKGYCNSYPKVAPQYDYQWQFWSGCMVNVPEYGWVHAIDYFNLNRAGIELNK